MTGLSRRCGSLGLISITGVFGQPATHTGGPEEFGARQDRLHVVLNVPRMQRVEPEPPVECNLRIRIAFHLVNEIYR